MCRPKFVDATSTDWNCSRSMGVTASNTPSLVLYLLWPLSAMGTFTAPVKLPQALQVDQSICLHHFLLASFWMIPVTLDACVISPLVLALVTRLLRNFSRKYRLFVWSKLMLCLQTKNSVIFVWCNLPVVLHAAIPSLMKKVAGVPSFACKIGLHPSQYPPSMNPYSYIWRPLDIVALVLMTILLS
jgi:hypothetical protein